MNDDTNISIDGAELVIDGKRMSFENPIAEILSQNQNLVIIRLKAPADSTCDRNVLAVNRKGDLIWRVKEPSRPPAHDSNPFVSIYRRNGQLWGHCYWGPEYRIDPATGNLLERNDVK